MVKAYKFYKRINTNINLFNNSKFIIEFNGVRITENNIQSNERWLVELSCI